MRVPVPLSEAFGAPFEELIAAFATEQGLLPAPEEIRSPRFIARSVIPHVRKLSSMFNREEGVQSSGLDPYWKEGSNPAAMRLAYFIYFMPSNLFRVASVWAELSRLGFKWKAGERLRAIEIGAGPATGACGIAAGEHYAPIGLPRTGDWALIEQDKAMLHLGAEWAAQYFAHEDAGDWGTRLFHRRIDFSRALLPPTAPKFNLWVMSYFLNEATISSAELARTLVDAWKKHLDDEGIAILCEPALKLQSRRLLELRRELLKLHAQGEDWFQILLPCAGHQPCGALGPEGGPDTEDWCHEEVTWWRPPYFRDIDRLAGLDRKTLPFSYLVITRSKRPRTEILPVLASSDPQRTYRLVSPAHKEGRELEFFVCGQEGKRRTRLFPREENDADIQRGDILLDTEIRGDSNASRIDRSRKV